MHYSSISFSRSKSEFVSNYVVTKKGKVGPSALPPPLPPGTTRKATP